jgi:ATP/maltotriose-dependent transcriptional regulator MalT
MIARDIAGFVAAGGYDILTAVLPRILDAIAASSENVTIVIDDFHIVRSVECAEQIDFFVKHLPEQARLLLMTRIDPALRLGRLRASGQLSEIRAEDLAFNLQEASSLLIADGVQFCSEEIAENLVLSLNTVKTHMRSLFQKLSVTRRADAVRRGRALGLC